MKVVSQSGGRAALGGTRLACILFLDGKPLVEGGYRDAVDLQVLHPPIRLIQGRPAWLLNMGRRPVKVPKQLLPAAGRRLVQAFAVREGAGAVPLDQIVAEPGKPVPPLMLPKVAIRYAYEDAAPLTP